MDISLGKVQDAYLIISWATLKSNTSFPYVILSSLLMGIDPGSHLQWKIEENVCVFAIFLLFLYLITKILSHVCLIQDVYKWPQNKAGLWISAGFRL